MPRVVLTASNPRATITRQLGSRQCPPRQGQALAVALAQLIADFSNLQNEPPDNLQLTVTDFGDNYSDTYL